MKTSTYLICSLLIVISSFTCLSQQTNLAGPNTNNSKFKQLHEELPTPNVYRTASGKPGHEYYQMKADYDIAVRLDDKNHKIRGEETITYHNLSPDPLPYLWLQLDQNRRSKDSDTYKVETSKIKNKRLAYFRFKDLLIDFDGGFKLEHVKSEDGKDLSYTVNKTMMRIDLPDQLMPGEEVKINLKWWYNINDRMLMGGRSGYEYFEADDNYLYVIGQFYPRMAVYNEVEGWQHKQFLGRGEFALPFGDFKVSITAPSDHVITATGELKNADKILSKEQNNRLKKALKSDEPVLIITQDEAELNEKSRSKSEKTWVFEAQNVRDFAFGSSRKFIWDAMGVKLGEKTVLAQSLYPKEGNPLWEQYSTKTVAHSLKCYSKYTFDYPYPVATSVHSAKIGMEYPMICFNFGRPETDGTYTKRTKYKMIGVIIHEIGHNYFPMIVNSDERQWAWMDEGLNSFIQYLTEQEFEAGFPSRRGEAHKIVNYMKGAKSGIAPIMTNSESIPQLGNNSYGKPAVALNILRETIMGRELFDFALKHYAQTWKFKHPTPADFFRCMEDASAVDLDWFWRGWFYTNDHVDLAIDNIEWLQVNSKDPVLENSFKRDLNQDSNDYITDIRNKEEMPKRQIDKDTDLKDFYSFHDPLEATELDKYEYQNMLKRLTKEQKEYLSNRSNFYEITFKNIGGLVMPIILQIEYVDGSSEIKRFPAEIWKLNNEQVKKLIITDKEIASLELDPFLETADTELDNNNWPKKLQPSRFDLYKYRSRYDPRGMNEMQRDKESKKLR